MFKRAMYQFRYQLPNGICGYGYVRAKNASWVEEVARTRFQLSKEVKIWDIKKCHKS